MESEADEARVLEAVMDRAKQLVQEEAAISEVPTEKAGTPSDDSTILASAKPNRLFALLIGVDRYKYQERRNLRGAVKDMRNVEAFLREQRPPVAAERIKTLADEGATEANIIKSIQEIGQLPSDEKGIIRGDPILIYYAGHGSNVPRPNGWQTTSSHIQCLTPHDARVEDGVVRGVISDRALGALLTKLADVKGKNITVILDCCHSGSGTRNDDSIPRSIDFKSGDQEYTISTSYQQELWDNENDVYDREATDERGIAHIARFANRGLQSHVLLAACGSEESAYEDRVTRQGRFTSALLALLRRAGPDTMTYSQVIKNLDTLSSQTPQCEGYEKDTRIIFDSGLVQRDRHCYGVIATKASYIICAGRDHEVKKGDVYAIYGSKEDYASVLRPFGKVTVDAVGADASSTLPFDNFDLRVLDAAPSAVAVLTEAAGEDPSGPFDAALARRKRTCYAIVKSSYTLRAGQIHGVSEGDVFTVYKDVEAYTSASPLFGKLVVNSVKAVTSLMSPFEDSDLGFLGDATHAVAVLSRVGKLDVFRVHVDIKENPELGSLVAKVLAKEAFNPANRYGRSMMLSTAKSASISVVPNGSDAVDFFILDNRIRGLGLEKLSGAVVLKETPLRAALRSAAHFFYHLGSSPLEDQQGFRNTVSVNMWEMYEEMDEEALVPMPVCRPGPKVVDFNTSGAFRPNLYQAKDGNDDSDEPSYGMDVSLSPNAEHDLFVWLFYFDCSTLEIMQYYAPPVVKDGKATASLLRSNTKPLPLNYGDAGSTPFIFELPEEMKHDVGFLRLFISTHDTDLSSIKQAPVVGPGRGSSPVLTAKSSVQGWDAISFPVVLTRVGKL